MERKGQPCAVLARGKMNSCLVMFKDGFTAVTSRNALRRADRMAAKRLAKAGAMVSGSLGWGFMTSSIM